MQRITNFHIDIVDCLEGAYLLLPIEARRLIEIYWRPLAAPAGRIRFEIPIYRWEEIVEEMRKCKYQKI